MTLCAQASNVPPALTTLERLRAALYRKATAVSNPAYEGGCRHSMGALLCSRCRARRTVREPTILVRCGAIGWDRLGSRLMGSFFWLRAIFHSVVRSVTTARRGQPGLVLHCLTRVALRCHPLWRIIPASHALRDTHSHIRERFGDRSCLSS